MSKIFKAKNREEWRKWLTEHFDNEQEIELLLANNKCKEKCISYNDAVEEALCFGWIDGVASKYDDNYSTRRFTPRRSNNYSRINIERLIWLNNNNLIHENVKDEVLKVINKEFVYAEDIISAIKKDKIVLDNYNNFSDSYKRIRIDYIEQARKDNNEFKKRLNNFIEKTKENKLIIGFGGNDKYYR